MVKFLNISKLNGGGTPRLHFLDAMRGFTMFLVVYGHVCMFTLGLRDIEPVTWRVLGYFHMPLFFFISGFVAYKPLEFWTKGAYIARLANKTRVQLVPTFVFYGLFILFGLSRWSFPGGYWFTLVLFEMFVCYFTTAAIAKIFAHRCYPVALIVSVAIVYVLGHLSFRVDSIRSLLCLGQLQQYYIFFIFGLLIKRYQEKFFNLLSNGLFMTAMVILGFGGLIMMFRFSTPIGSATLLWLILSALGIALITLVVNCFYRTADYWNTDAKFSRLLRWVGRRTLDIYMLHYFFIWPAIPSLRGFLHDNPNEVLICIVCAVLTVGVMAMSLLVSGVLRSSSLVAKWLFGVKNTVPVTKSLP